MRPFAFLATPEEGRCCTSENVGILFLKLLKVPLVPADLPNAKKKI
jgi:hypothetical protein